MSWSVRGMREQRAEFVIRAGRGESMSGLCREYGISRPTGYVWLRRFQEQGVGGLEERSRRPRTSPGQTRPELEQRIVDLRGERPDWGARKLASLLEKEGTPLPVITVHRVLERHGLVLDPEGRRHATGRFERSAPNQLWQMDFKGYMASATGPLSVIDDHSRYVVALKQTGTTGMEAVRKVLEEAFQDCGVPEAMLMDHGVPFWNNRSPNGWTRLRVWLIKQGVPCYFSGIRHPQTQGKVERFHGALQKARRRPDGHQWLSQLWLDRFREEYNHLRPHEALDGSTPASVWKPSLRTYDPCPAAWDYGDTAELRTVNAEGDLFLNGRYWSVGEALASETVMLQRLDQRVFVYFCSALVREIDFNTQLSTPVDSWRPMPNV